MRILLMLMLCGWLAGCGPSQPEESTEAPETSVAPREPSHDQEQLDQLAAAYSASEVEAVIPELERYVAMYPQVADAWAILGNAYRDSEQLDKALEAYRQAILVDASAVAAHTGMGIVFRRRGEYRRALDAYQRALQFEPNKAETYSSMMVVAWKMDRTDLALQFAERGYELDQSDPVIASNLAMAYHMNEQYDERDRMVEVAEQLGSKDIERMKQVFSGEVQP